MHATNQLLCFSYGHFFLHLSKVSFVEGHSLVPKMSEKVWENFLLDVVRLHSVRHTALLHHLSRDCHGYEDGLAGNVSAINTEKAFAVTVDGLLTKPDNHRRYFRSTWMAAHLRAILWCGITARGFNALVHTGYIVSQRFANYCS